MTCNLLSNSLELVDDSMAEIWLKFLPFLGGGGLEVESGEGAVINAVALHQSGAGQIPVLLPYVR